MRVLTVVGLALAGGAAALQAQHAHQIEFGGFGSYSHFDDVFNLKDGAGYGGRIGFFLNDYLGIELAGGQTTATPTGGGATTPVRPGNASLIINSGGEHNILYVLGGYSRMSMGSAGAYALGYDAVHGAIGDRIFFGNYVALRLEAGVYYGLSQSAVGKHPLNYEGTAGLSLVLGGPGHGRAEAPPISKEKRDSIIAAGGTPPPEEKPSRQRFVETGAGWAHQWFWGPQAGVMIIKTDEGTSAEPTFGGHWLITGKRTALYVAYEQAFFLSDRHATIIEPGGTIEPSNIAFRNMRRIMAGVLAFPVQKAVQPYGGAGFAIMEVLSPEATCTGCSLSDTQILQDEAAAAGTSAFFWLMGGIEARQGRLALFGHYIFTTAASGFLINGHTHTFQGGLRYSLGSAREEATE